MITKYLAITALAVVNLTFKGAGPAILGDHRFSARSQAVLAALPAALLAGLIAVDLLGPRWTDADWTTLPGLLTIAVARRLRAPQLAGLLAGVLVTAALRALV